MRSVPTGGVPADHGGMLDAEVDTRSHFLLSTRVSRTAAQQQLTECVVKQRLAASRRARSTNEGSCTVLSARLETVAVSIM